MGLSCFGFILRREVWLVHMHDAPLYPNLSLLLVGPSGCGKDTTINFGRHYLYDMGMEDFFIGGRTIEGVYKQLLKHNDGTPKDPAIAYLPIGELTAVIGNKDYQQGIISGLTDLLSGNPLVNVSTSKDPNIAIHNPTLTVHAGSTIEWLHKAMPDGALEGGFVGRFLVVVTEHDAKQKFCPMPAYEISSTDEQQALKEARDELYMISQRALRKTEGLGEVYIVETAQEIYYNWYYNRFKLFSPAVIPYANRCRDTVLKLALISAMTRQHWRWVDDADIQFAIDLMQDTANKIDKVIIPQSEETRCTKHVLALLPCSYHDIINNTHNKYPLRVILQAMEALRAGGKIIDDKNIIRLA